MTVDFPVDRIVVSANENWLYLDFWPFVAYAYRTMFPGVKVTLAFVTERLESDPFVAQLREHGNVVLLRPVREIPQAAQCKMARYFIAAQCGDEVCYIDDIDWIPIDREWHLGKVRQRRPGSLLLVGAEVYGADHQGQVPASMMTAEGRVFRALFNPTDLPFQTWLYSLGGRAGRHRDIYSRVHHEGMMCTTDSETLGALLFSDEALIVQLRAERPVPTTHVERGYDPATDTIDRTYWRALNLDKLDRGGYLGAHTGRPYLEHKAGNDAIVDYIRRRYDGGPVPAPLNKSPGIDPDMQFASDAQRDAFAWTCANLPANRAVLEVGGGHVTTNYLSRYYELRTIHRDFSLANQYPSHSIYSSDKNGGYSVEAVRRGFACYNTYRPHGALFVGDSRGVDQIAEALPVSAPIIIADADTDAGRSLSAVLSARAGHPAWSYGKFAVI